MKNRGIDFPHPLLKEGGDDYIDCNFEIELDESKTIIEGDSIVLAVSYFLNSEGLNNLITTGAAKVILSVQSVILSYRQNFDFKKGVTNTHFKVPKNNVANKIEIIGYIVATDVIKSFYLKEHNFEYYNGISFNIRKGDILAKSTQKDIPIDDSELEKPLSSVFNISEDEKMDMMIYPDFEGDKVNIKLKTNVYEIYYHLRGYNNGSCRRALAGLVVLPVLTEAIDKIIGNYQCDENLRDELMFDKRWFRAIEKKLKEINIDLENPAEPSVSIASKLLGDIVFDSLSALKDIIDDESSGNEIIRIGGED